jgi:adenylate cyclase
MVRFALLLFVLGVAASVGSDWPLLWLFDFYQRLSPPVRDASQITIVDIDGESVRRIGPWPWPRDRLAQLVDKARSARVIGVDILLLDPGAGLDLRLALRSKARARSCRRRGRMQGNRRIAR